MSGDQGGWCYRWTRLDRPERVLGGAVSDRVKDTLVGKVPAVAGRLS